MVPLPGFVKRRTQGRIMHAALRELKDRVGERRCVRVLLFTGKGGVGKTTTAAATALRCADAGLRTIVLSTDPAHSLADAFDRPLGSRARGGRRRPLGPAARRAGADGGHLGRDPGVARRGLRLGGRRGIEAEELAVIPGLDEIFALSDIKEDADSGEWDVVVVDCAPTAETIRLLSLPDVLCWYMDRVFPTSRRLNKVVSPILSQGHEPAGRRRRRVRLGAALLRPPRRGPRAADRHGEHQRPAGRQPRAAGGRRGPPHLHLPVAVRVPGRRRRRQPPAARGHHRPVVRDVEGHATPSTSPRSRTASRRCRSCGPSWRPTRSSASTPCAGSAPTSTRDLDPAAVLHEGEPLSVTKRATGYELALELPFAGPRRARARPPRRRAAGPRRAVPPGPGPARLAAPPVGAARRRCATAGCG